MSEADRDYEQNAVNGPAKRALDEIRVVPCLFYDGQRCGVVRSTAGRRLYHYECVVEHLRGAVSRPRVYATPRSATAIRFPTDMLAQLHKAADERDVSVNWLVNRAVSDFLPRLLPVDEIVWTRPATDRAPAEPRDIEAPSQSGSRQEGGR